MKQSDSTNSLTELTGRDECFICLSAENDKEEPLVDSRLLRTCGCKFSVHPACWNVWMKNKTDYDCPICRKQSVFRVNIPPNPVFLVAIPEEHRRQGPLSVSKVVASLLLLAIVAGVVTALVIRE